LIQSRLSLANRQLEVEKTRNGLLPKLDMFASYSRLSSGETTSDAMRHLDDSRLESYEIGLSLGLSPLNRSERAGFRRAKLDQQKVEAAILNLKQLIEAGVRQDVIEVQRQWERVRATQQVVKSRAEQLEVEKSKFLVGKSTNLDVSLVQRDLIEAQLAEVTARIRYIQSLTGLYLGEGTLLERRGVGPDYG
jgi:outer membrane protein TolC